MSVMPTWIRLRPISITTTPVTTGVMTRLSHGNTVPSAISIRLPARQVPNSTASTCSSLAFCERAINPAVISADTKLKLVPWMLNSPEPNGPMRWDWIQVATPETTSAIDSRLAV